MPINQMTLEDFLTEKAGAELEIKQEVQSILEEFERITGVDPIEVTVNMHGTVVGNVNISAVYETDESKVQDLLYASEMV